MDDTHFPSWSTRGVGSSTLIINAHSLIINNIFSRISLGGYEERNGVIFSAPNVVEKGKLNVRIEVTTPGGHSSVPPPHTVRPPFFSSTCLLAHLEDEPLSEHWSPLGTHNLSRSKPAPCDSLQKQHLLPLAAVHCRTRPWALGRNARPDRSRTAE